MDNMLTKDFITRMEEIGCNIHLEDVDIKIWCNGYNLGFVSASDPYIMATYRTGFANCGLDSTSLNLVNLYMGRLSRTEIEDRNEPLFYLAIDLPLVNSSTLYFGYKDDTEGVYSLDYAISFTQEEIDERMISGFYPVSTTTLM